MKVGEIRQLVEQAHDHIGKLCTGEDRWKMTVPPQESDSDILFTRLADTVDFLLNVIEEERDEREVQSE